MCFNESLALRIRELLKIQEAGFYRKKFTIFYPVQLKLLRYKPFSVFAAVSKSR